VVGVDRWSCDWTVRKALCSKLGSVGSSALPALTNIRFPILGRYSVGSNYQAPRIVIDRDGTEQDYRVRNPAVSDGLFHGPSLARRCSTVHERRVGKQSIVNVVLVESVSTMGLGRCCCAC